VRTKRTVYY